MFSFWQLEWLFLLTLAIVFLLVGCSIFNARQANVTPMPTPLPTPLITPYFSEALLPLILLSPFEIQPINPNEVNSPPQGLRASSATCFSHLRDGYLCLGQFLNETRRPMEDVQFRVRLYRANRLLAVQDFALLQKTILPQSNAPYHSLFLDLEPNQVGQGSQLAEQGAVYARADILSYRNSPSHAPLTILAERGFVSATGRYVITATFRNDHSADLSHIQVIATVVNPEKEVVAYRISNLENGLKVGEIYHFRLELIPQIVSLDLEHELSIVGD